MLYIDTPYGLGFEDWDKKAFDLQHYRVLFKQMEAITSVDNWIAVIWHTRDNGAVVVAAMTEQGFKHAQEVVWYKFNQNQEGTQNLVNACEHCTVGFKEKRALVHVLQPVRAPQRHCWCNPEEAAQARERQPCEPEKPPYLARSLAKAWLPPGSTIIVGGVGAGGDVEGLISAGMNVIGFENDSEQTNTISTVWTKYESDFKSTGKFGWSEQEALGIFGGMHFDGASNLSNYKAFLQSRIAEEDSTHEDQEHAGAAIPSTQRSVGPTCGSAVSRQTRTRC